MSPSLEDFLRTHSLLASFSAIAVLLALAWAAIYAVMLWRSRVASPAQARRNALEVLGHRVLSELAIPSFALSIDKSGHYLDVSCLTTEETLALARSNLTAAVAAFDPPPNVRVYMLDDPAFRAHPHFSNHLLLHNVMARSREHTHEQAPRAGA